MPETECPVLFCLHFLGGSKRGWRWVEERLAGRFECIPVDLPGFGAATALTGYGVADMAAHVAAAVRARAPARWQLVGHSMGAKVAMALSRRAEDGDSGLSGLERLVLLAGSPPAPEPMKEEQRQAMLSWLGGDEASRRAEADGYLNNNVGAPLHPAVHGVAAEDVLAANRDAWTAWLDRGSREDWAARVGVLRTPALLVVGTEDPDLGEQTQRRLVAPHFERWEIVALAGAGHLLPMERPDEVAALIAGAPFIPAGYRALIDSRRVSSRTRAALLARAEPDAVGYVPATLSAAQLDVLRAMLDRVLPQPGPGAIDLAARIDAGLAGLGDGWRFADLPPDVEAYRAGIDTVEAAAARHGQGFALLTPAMQDALLRTLADGSAPGGALSSAQLKMWFEDVRAEAARLYVAHPATLARMGYSGIGYGGDGPGKPGFVRLGAGEREAWEPVAP